MTIRDRITRLERVAKRRDPVFDEVEVRQALADASDEDLERLEAFLVRAEKDDAGHESALYEQCRSIIDLFRASRGDAPTRGPGHGE